MSDINCSACEELRTEAPDFATNGVTSAVCASLKNDTGLSTTNGHNNNTDLTDANDCLIGRMDDELEAYDVCDWKDFMHKFIPNLYEFLKAILCSLAGIWTNIHDLWSKVNPLCQSIDNLLGLIQGSKPRNHTGEWTQYWQDHVSLRDMTDYGFQWEWQYFKPSFRCQIDEGAGCDASKKLGRYLLDWTYTDGSHYPHIFSFAFNANLTVGEVIGTIPASAVVGNDMALDTWKSIIRASSIWLWGSIHGDTLLYIAARGYTIYQGVTFNEDLASYGEDTMVMTVGALVGASAQGGFNGNVAGDQRSYTV